MDKWIELVKAKMSELKITQTELGERVGMSQGGIGHWLNKRREPGITEMNRVLQALGMDFLEVVLVIREPQITSDDDMPLAQKYNPYFRYPVSDWQTTCEVRESDAASYAKASGKQRFELTDYHARGPAFWLTVTGDSMTAPSGQSIAEGMLILVDPAAEAVPGKLVIAQWPDSPEAIFRKLDEEGGQRYLVPLNPTWPKALLTDECRIIGVVVQATARY
ncbi:putative HTH-type transcriptional regulator [Pseudomonas fluorescens]|jgi:SOS-response transcriptional repressor LexA|uniref:Helix-turn-helix domain-containing protein n=2 Tax=Pseudomonas TaxID=286 RepID=A0ABX8PSE1_9PSED|nr:MULTISPECIES: S24 family peptidase [Pseudomonas]PNG42406.1 Cro/Cl family transcriptional regulator [Pseudomonas asplenii]QXI04229.1 helix-turn-helix domain-containing protein [Pseudomonas tensinigenes]VVM99183.1 putative HTH-type transcriptional regulator [Pseudomonas fluorescens]VVN23246.1 putative HTH-type transcriptional regulator [Pseudomonas fluorescens]VVN59310.1 putative HTH-type transcriptional regulator [Pseudomonas fluorescens]